MLPHPTDKFRQPANKSRDPTDKSRWELTNPDTKLTNPDTSKTNSVDLTGVIGQVGFSDTRVIGHPQLT